MAQVTDTSQPATADAELTPPTPDWEIYIKDHLEEDLREELPGDRNELAIIAIIRDFLRLDDDKLDTAAADQAAERIKTYYHDTYLVEENGFLYRDADDHGAADVTQSVCYNAWNIALQFHETDIRHTALVSLIAAFKNASAATDFDPEVSTILSPRWWTKSHVSEESSDRLCY
jgi:hypothetical protein